MLPTSLTPENIYTAYRNWMISHSQSGTFGPLWIRSVGLRFDTEYMEVGEECNPSHDSNDQLLDGTCAFFIPVLTEEDTLEDVQYIYNVVLSRLEEAYSGVCVDRVHLIAGTGHEDGEWHEEIVIENAEIAAVFE